MSSQPAMEYSDLTFDYDMTSDFIIIQSCLRDERHHEVIQNSENVTLLEDHLTFNLGDSFESYEALLLRLEAHCKQSNVYYWMRDSRTVEGAKMKTSRHIDPKLKYYNAKYACVYGGQKRFSRGQGIRNSMSVKLDCPAHITLKANLAGKRLDVVSVCNHHTHDISPLIGPQMRQGRKLSTQLKTEVLDLIRMGVQKRRIMDYIKWKSGKVLLYKDMLNLAATVRDLPKPPLLRRQELFKALRSFETANNIKSSHESDSVNEPNSNSLKRKHKLSKKKALKRLATGNHNDSYNPISDEHSSKKVEEFIAKIEVIDQCSDSDPPVADITDTSSNVMELFYQKNIEGECVLKSFTQNKDVLTFKAVDADSKILEYNNVKFSVKRTEDGVLTHAQSEIDNEITLESLKLQSHKIELDGQTFTLLNDDEHITLELDNSVEEEDEENHETNYDCEHVAVMNDENILTLDTESSDYDDGNVIVEDTSMMPLSDVELQPVIVENLSENENSNILPNNLLVNGDNEIVVEEISNENFKNEDNIEIIKTEICNTHYIEEKCMNCEKIELDLNEEINVLRNEKRELTLQTEILKKRRDKLLKEMEDLNNIIRPKSLPVGVKPIMIKNKLYFIKL